MQESQVAKLRFAWVRNVSDLVTLPLGPGRQLCNMSHDCFNYYFGVYAYCGLMY